MCNHKAKGGPREYTPATLFNARELHDRDTCMEMRGRAKTHTFYRSLKKSRGALGEKKKVKKIHQEYRKDPCLYT